MAMARCDVLTRSRARSLLQIAAAKSLSRIFGQNSGNSIDTSKAFFEMVTWKFESSQVSQPVRRLETLPSVTSETPANGGLLRIGYRSPGSQIGPCGNEIADSLRRIFEIFPFLGDSDRRPGSIGTAWREPQSYRGGWLRQGEIVLRAQNYEPIQSWLPRSGRRLPETACRPSRTSRCRISL